jgi:ABC-type phosphate/phosphonate transport system substrate-binding protein
VRPPQIATALVIWCFPNQANRFRSGRALGVGEPTSRDRKDRGPKVREAEPMLRLSALPMYDFPELIKAHDALWSFVAAELRSSAVWGIPEALDRSISYDQTWTDPRLLLGQSCGLPIVDQLDGLVSVLGGFAVTDGSPEATYTSKLVVHRESGIEILSDLRWSKGVRAAINGRDSLSGYVSFGAACAEALKAGAIPDNAAFAHVEATGAHVLSAAALADRTMDLACMDGHTFALLQRHRPEAVNHLRVIGSGPTIPCLPLITALPVDDELVALLRFALNAAATAESLADARDALGITGFVSFGNDRYEPIRAMHQRAKWFFDRLPA